jgi:tripartite-type tricarboxylate transporter receptor subunit TctC
VPARTPQPVVLVLNQAILATLKTEAMQTSLTTHAMDAAGSTPAEFADRIRRESTQWASAVKAANFALE